MTEDSAKQYEAIAIVEETKKKQIAEGWSPEQEQILKVWAEKAAGYRWLHEQSARHYRRLNNRLVYPQILISTVTGVGGFGITTSGDNFSDFAYLGYIIAFLNILGALITSFQKFIGAAEKSEMHATVSRQYAAFFRNISLELSLNPRDRNDCLDMCKTCRTEYDRLMNVSPPVPQKIICRFKDRFPHATNKPDIANGLSDLKIWEKTEVTKTSDAFLKMKSFYKFLYNNKRFANSNTTLSDIA